MFHGPNGTLAPIPARMSHDIVPRIHESPSMRALKIMPAGDPGDRPEPRHREELREREVPERRDDVRVVDVLGEDDPEDDDENADDEPGPERWRRGGSAARRPTRDRSPGATVEPSPAGVGRRPLAAVLVGCCHGSVVLLSAGLG